MHHRPTVQEIQINECSSPSFLEEWNCIKSKVESIYNDNGTRTEKYISEYVFVGDKLVDAVRVGNQRRRCPFDCSSSPMTRQAVPTKNPNSALALGLCGVSKQAHYTLSSISKYTFKNFIILATARNGENRLTPQSFQHHAKYPVVTTPITVKENLPSCSASFSCLLHLVTVDSATPF